MPVPQHHPPAPPDAAPEPDPAVEPEGYVVVQQPNDRIHFLDWGGPDVPDGPGVLLVHGLGATAWGWIAVARRLLRRRRIVAMDLRGHGLSDAPTEGYDAPTLADDVVAVAEGSGLLAAAGDRVVLAGHGLGAAVAASAAVRLGDRCAGLVLVDGGWEDLRESSRMEPDEFLRELDEPPEVLRSMSTFLADREGWNAATWDADQERAARATVVATHAGRVVPVTRPHVLAACVRTMFDYRPAAVLTEVDAPIVAIVAADDEDRSKDVALRLVDAARTAAGRRPIAALRFPEDGHNLPRYRPAELAATILAVASRGP